MDHMNNPKISVIIPVYNVEKYLAQCLDSVVNQTFKDIEIICVNDGSTDGSEQILNEFANNDTRIHVITQENSGPGTARNKGLLNATGEYIYFIDSDDYLCSTALEDMFEQCVKYNLDVCICRGRNYNVKTGKCSDIPDCINTRLLPDKVFFSNLDISDYIFQFCVGWPWDKLFKRKLLVDNEIVFPNLSNSEDTFFVYKSLISAERISCIDKILITHRIGLSGSVSSSRVSAPDAFITSMELLRQELLGNKKFKIFEKSFVNYFLTFSYWHLQTIPENYRDELFQKIRTYLEGLNYLYGKEEMILCNAYLTNNNWSTCRKIAHKEMQLYDNILQKIFSLKNSIDKSHKVCTILGLKLKIRRANG